MAFESVQVLLIFWEDDDLHSPEDHLEFLDAYQKRCHFEAEYLMIEASDPGAVRTTVEDFLKRNASPSALQIIHYQGHGLFHEKRTLFGATRIPVTMLDWTTIQDGVIYHAAANVLVILDCCNAGSARHLPSGNASLDPGPGAKAIFAASSDSLPSYGNYFSKAVLSELAQAVQAHRQINIIQLYEKVDLYFEAGKLPAYPEMIVISKYKCETLDLLPVRRRTRRQKHLEKRIRAEKKALARSADAARLKEFDRNPENPTGNLPFREDYAPKPEDPKKLTRGKRRLRRDRRTGRHL